MRELGDDEIVRPPYAILTLPYDMHPAELRAKIERECYSLYFCDQTIALRDSKDRWHVAITRYDGSRGEAGVFADRLNGESAP
jgi:hypothetical protein